MPKFKQYPDIKSQTCYRAWKGSAGIKNQVSSMFQLISYFVVIKTPG